MGFGNLKGKNPSSAGAYINDEVECTVEVTVNKAKASEKGDGKYYFITEFKVLEALSGPIQANVQRTQTININTAAGPGDCVAYLAAAAGIDPYNTEGDFEEALIAAYAEALEMEDLSIEQIAEIVCDDNQPLQGVKLRLQTVNKPMGPQDIPNPKKFTKHLWFPVAED